jgi:hypothetical protein
MSEMSEMWQQAMVEAFRETSKRVALFLPKLLALLTFILVGLLVGRLIRFLVLRILKAVRFDQLCERMGMTSALAKAGITKPVSDLVGRLSFWIVFLLFAFMGIDALDLPATAKLMSAIIGVLPNLFAATVLLLFGLLLANFFREAALITAVNAQIPEARLIANLIRWGIVIFTAAMVLTQLGIATEIIVAAFSITFGGIVLALAIALGLGGRNIAKDALERRLRQKQLDKDEVSHI